MELKKVGKIELKNEPYLKPVSNEDIGFYNLDDNTAVLRFFVTKNNKPLLISKDNTETYVYLESDNGSNQIVEDIEYIDPLNGVVQISVPIEFLQASTDTSVTGQIYISVNQQNKVDAHKSSTAVLTEFKFDVKDARINKINGATKITYIRMFDELKQRIEKTAEEIKEQLDNMEDYIVKVKQATKDGVNQINSESKKATDAIKKSSDKSLKDIDNSLNGAVQTINNTRQDSMNELNNKGNQYLKDLRAEVTNIQNILNREGYVTSEAFNSNIETLKENINNLTPKDTGATNYDLINGAVKNRHYKKEEQNGFNCTYRIIEDAVKKEIIVRINADNFKNGETIAQLPNNIVTNTQTGVIRAVPTKAYGANVVIEPTGDMKIWINNTSEWETSRDAYVYGELHFTEPKE